MAPQYVTRFPPEDDADVYVHAVPFVPWRCACGSTKPRSYGQRGVVRFHVCSDCGLKFRSVEIDPDEVRKLPAFERAVQRLNDRRN